MGKLKIKNGDTVQVIAGDDKGKTGSVLKIDPMALKLQVSGVRINNRINKKEKTLYKEEGWLDYSNVRLARDSSKPKKKKSDKKLSQESKTP